MWYAISCPNSCTPHPRGPPQSLKFLQKRSVPTSFRIRASLSNQYNGATVEYTPWLIVGLGNPGKKYHRTRHNVGFEMIDAISEAQGIPMNTIQSKALVGIGSIGEVPILLAKPQAYMNFSGESVGPLAAHYHVPLRHILLAYDEMSLPNGVLRVQPKGGHGHHNGLGNFRKYETLVGIGRYVISQVARGLHISAGNGYPKKSNSKAVGRRVIGIGNPPGNMDLKAYLLQKFSALERHQIDEALKQGVGAVRSLVLDGFSQSITRFNLGQKYKYHKVEL
ncbi:Peptidyl-tRNA hydrolase [Parasponia andersonii]|uniref:Peptidyl-tRNA hydrolase n=1 Tax=Parasponia andersonii TaxID=3476 RepID=A0A2P5B1Z9_PARAD|nr:Peptidyl-tRNA hydrolase [Parasponia andersonii]